MIVDLRLQNFRSYEDESFEFGPGVNIIVGPNGSGKTNLLEAILVVARGSSYRVADTELVRFSAEWFRLDSTNRTVKLQTVPKKKTYEIDERVYYRLTKPLPVVLFEPNHLQLLHGSPEARREFLDDILEQTEPGFMSFRRNYKRTLAQRNALLKRTQVSSAQELFPWDLRLSELGSVITRKRAALVENINAKLGELYKNIAASDTVVTITYQPKFALDQYETLLMQKLESHRNEDHARGFTAYGPHREDFTVFFDGKPANETASRGEIRTVLLALKIIELELLEEATGQTPLLLLDDVFSELDGKRRRALTSYLQKYQTFLTTTDADVVVKHFTDSTIIPLG